MKLLDYIRGLRKGKEAHRLEKESMKDPFLADAMDGYGQVEGNHEQRIGQLRMQVSARATKKRNLSKKQNSYAVTWSISACLVIGIGISCYFLFLKKRMTDDVFIAKEEIPSAVFEPISPKEEISSLAETKIKQDSTHEVTATPTDKKDIVAKSKSIPKTQSAPVAITPVIEETVGRTDIQEERIVADTDTSLSEVHQLKAAKAATPNLNLIKGKVTDEKGEPIIGASVAYTGTNIGTVTDLNGEFILKKEKGNKQLTAQFIGYEPVEIPVDTSRTMLIAMNEDQQALSEVVVVGYGKKKKSNVAGATAKINLKAKEKYKTPQPVIGKRKYKKYLEEKGYVDHIIELEDSSATVELAAQALGVDVLDADRFQNGTDSTAGDDASTGGGGLHQHAAGTGHHQGGKLHHAAALDGLGYAVQGNELLHELAGFSFKSSHCRFLLP